MAYLGGGTCCHDSMTKMSHIVCVHLVSIRYRGVNVRYRLGDRRAALKQFMVSTLSNYRWVLDAI